MTDDLHALQPDTPAPAPALPTVALVGNPNCGKTSLFNRLTGLAARVGNYPGVTVDRRDAVLEIGSLRVRIVDLPGSYSLSAHSLDEQVAVDALTGDLRGEARPDLVIHVVDASNLERNLYLHAQIRELGLPTILALNMVDVAERRGVCIDPELLSQRLGVPLVETQGHRGLGIEGLRGLLARWLEDPRTEAMGESEADESLAPELAAAARSLRAAWGERAEAAFGRPLRLFEYVRALVDRDGHAESRTVAKLGEEFAADLVRTREELAAGPPLASLEAKARYAWVRERIEGCRQRAGSIGPSLSERLDRVLTHRWLGLLVFTAVMLVVFQSIFRWSVPLMELIDRTFRFLSDSAASVLPPGPLTSLVADGVIGGVGSVVIFLPQILILFLLIAILEDCGYMARVAFIMDKVMARCGLSGKSFIPMLGGFACAVPAIISARVIEDRRDRLATILVIPFTTCSARLPVYSLLIGTFVPDHQLAGGLVGLRGVTLLALYALGVVVAIFFARVFKSTLLRGATPPFVLELPTYKMPSVTTVLRRSYDRGKTFLVQAGTVILAMSLLVWALAYYPRSDDVGRPYRESIASLERELDALPETAGDARAEVEVRLAEVRRQQDGAYLRSSLFARTGRAVEPLFEPLGWDWKISMAVISSFPAREMIVSTLGTIYNLGGEVDEESVAFSQRLRAERASDGRPVFSLAVALSLLVFFALCCQCASTVVVIGRETASWRWAAFTFVYMTCSAYLAALVVYQVASRF